MSNTTTLVLNSSNNVDPTNKSTYRYQFVNGSFTIPEDSDICISSVVLPYSWFNVNSQIYNNASFSYTFPMASNFTGSITTTTLTVTALANGVIIPGQTLTGVGITVGTNVLAQLTGTTGGIGTYSVSISQVVGSISINGFVQQVYPVTLPNGYYSVSDINNYLQNLMISRGQFLVSGTSNIYYLSITVNATYYSNTILATVLPLSLPSGYTNPINTVTGSPQFGFPLTSVTPQFTVSASYPAFGTLIGYTVGSYPPAPASVSYSTIGNQTPNATPVNSLIIRCNLVNNNAGFPTDILDSMPITGAFGTNINYVPNFEKWVSISSGTYYNLILSFQDQNLNTIQFNDTNILVNLLIKKGTKDKQRDTTSQEFLGVTKMAPSFNRTESSSMGGGFRR